MSEPSPALNRQAIWDGVGAFISAITNVDGSLTFRTWSPNVKHWIDVQPADCPAAFLDPITEVWKVRKGMPPVITMAAKLYVYISTGYELNPTVDANALLNPIIDAVQAAIRIDDPINEAATLGGLVSHCAIEGKMERHSGALGSEAVVAIPIVIVVSP